MLQSEAPPLREPRALSWSVPRRMAERVSWPLVAILAVQAGFSLAVIMSNRSPFGDEANYLWQGHLEWAHWLHGYTIPHLHDSGAPEIYPALGALADSVGGLTGARILSLCFMLGATTLLYLTASRLFGRRAAIVGSALWALSEPVLRLAFATYDPMACFLVTLSAWLALQAGVRRRRGVWVAASAIAIALACVTAVSFAIMFPVVIAFAFFVWADTMGARRAWWYIAWVLGGTIGLAAVTATVLHLWKDAVGSTLSRHHGLGAGVASVARSAWSWDGLMLALAGIGLLAALVRERRWSRKLLLLTLVGAGLLVPVYQAHIGTGYALDKHMSAGTWFLAIAAGYGVARATANQRWKPLTAGLAGAAFLAYPAISGLWYATNAFNLWPDTATLVAQVEPLLKATSRPILTTSNGNLGVDLEYSTPQGHQWTRWTQTDSPPVGINTGKFGIIVMRFNSTINSPQLPRLAVTTGDTRILSAKILTLSTNSRGEFAIVRDIGNSRHYHLQDVIPFGTSNPAASRGVFAVWKRVG